MTIDDDKERRCPECGEKTARECSRWPCGNRRPLTAGVRQERPGALVPACGVRAYEPPEE